MTLSEYAKLFIGTRYVWGGNTPEQGFDCSGFIQEVLRSQGFDPNGDQTAQGLFNYFKQFNYKTSKPTEDCLLFFGQAENKITHVALAINQYQMIEAGGEGSTSTTNGFVRCRLINNRKDLISSIKI